MNFDTITPADIQPKKTAGESCDTRVRKAWVLQMPEEQKAKFEKFPGYVRHQLYKSFDSDIIEIWVKLMRNAHQAALKDGAKYIRVAGISRLEDEFCADSDELLIMAAQLWIEEFQLRSAQD